MSKNSELIYKILTATLFASIAISCAGLDGKCRCEYTYCGAPCDEYYGISSNKKKPEPNKAPPEKKFEPRQTETRKPKESYVGSGTGFVISPNGLALTNRHVVNMGDTHIAIFKSGNNFVKYPITVLNCLKEDACLIQIENFDLDVFPVLLSTNYEAGEEVIALGYPLIEDLGAEIKVSNGIINSTTGYKGDVSYLQISIPINPGNSGGPIINLKGQAIGISTWVIDELKYRISTGNQASTVSYGLKIEACYSLIKPLLESQVQLTEELKISDLVKVYGPSTFILAVLK